MAKKMNNQMSELEMVRAAARERIARLRGEMNDMAMTLAKRAKKAGKAIGNKMFDAMMEEMPSQRHEAHIILMKTLENYAGVNITATIEVPEPKYRRNVVTQKAIAKAIAKPNAKANNAKVNAKANKPAAKKNNDIEDDFDIDADGFDEPAPKRNAKANAKVNAKVNKPAAKKNNTPVNAPAKKMGRRPMV